MPIARLAKPDDLDELLALFRASEVSVATSDPAPIWRAMLDQPGMCVFVSADDVSISGGVIVATATLIMAPNLLRSGRSHGFLENVMTRPIHQGRGLGTAVVGAALAAAWEAGCHQVLLQSGRADLRVHQFYRALGFESGVREAYVAQRPLGT
jgi:GNAT superfamily N-acetyltransferase